MADTRYQQTPDGDAAPKMPTEQVRQGQNVKGMIWVLVVGLVLVVIAYAVMLALSSQPVTLDNRPIEDAATTSPGPLSVPETPPPT